MSNSQNNYCDHFVIQKRSLNKEYCPGAYDLAHGGVMAPDETNELNAQRELEEELGIKRDLASFKLLDQFFYKDFYANTWGNVFLIEITQEEFSNINI